MREGEEEEEEEEEVAAEKEVGEKQKKEGKSSECVGAKACLSVDRIVSRGANDILARG